MALPKELAPIWEQFAGLANPSALHAADRDRLFDFAARAYVLGEKLNLQDLRADLATRGFSDEEQSSVMATLEDAPGLLHAYEAARLTSN